jgi:hypothetical protein
MQWSTQKFFSELWEYALNYNVLNIKNKIMIFIEANLGPRGSFLQLTNYIFTNNKFLFND